MAEVTVGDNDYGSYVDLDEADAYLAADVLRATAWALRNDDVKGRGLVSATRLLQRLPWSSGTVPGVDDPAVPVVVREVTAMLAADLLAKPRLFSDASGNSNVKSAKAGSAAVEFFRPVTDGPVLPVALWNMLAMAGLVGMVGSGGGTAGAIVSGICAGRRPLMGRYAGDYVVSAEDHD